MKLKKIIISAVLGMLSFSSIAHAQVVGGITVPQGGTGLISVPAGYLLMGSTSPNHLVALSSTTFNGTSAPGGTSGQLQFNNGGSFGGTSTPYVTSIIATGTATSSLPNLFTNVLSLGATAISYIQSLFSATAPIVITTGNITCNVASGSQPGCLSSSDWTTFNGKQAAGSYITALTGDGSASGPGSAALTLATVNSNTGTFGGASSVPTITVNGKGLITAISTTTVVAPATTLTGTTLASNVVTSSLTSVGTLGSLTVSATSTLTGLKLTNLANTVLGVDGSGNVIATTSSGGGTNYFSNSGASTTLTTGNQLIANTLVATSSTATSSIPNASTTNTVAQNFLIDSNTTQVGKIYGVTSPSNATILNVGTNNDFAIQPPISLSTGIAFSSINDNNSSNEGLEFRASTFDFTQGNVGIASTTPGYALGIGGTLGVTSTSTLTGLKLTNLSNSILAVDSSGNIIATTTSAGGVTAVNASAPLNSSGGSTPSISLTGVIGFANGGTGTSSCPANDVFLSNGTIANCVATSSLGISGGGAVSSVSNSDGTLTISPTTGVVVASLALGHANTWTGGQIFGNATSTNFFSTSTVHVSATTTNLFATSTILVNATSTNLFATTASTTNLFGAGLANCSTSMTLAWSAGTFTCSTLQPSGMTGSTHNGQVLITTSDTAGWGAVDLSNSSFAVTNQLGVGNGGTGSSSYAVGSILTGSSTNPIYALPASTTGSVLSMLSNGLPGWVATSSLGISGGGGTNYFTNSSASTSLTTGSNLLAGIGTFGQVIATGTATSTFASNVSVGSTTASTTFIVDTSGHMFTGGSQPTCTTNCTMTGGDDNDMRIVSGTSVTSITITFASTWVNQFGVNISPLCWADDESQVSTGVEASSTPTTVVLTLPTALSSKNIAVFCRGSENLTQ